MNLRSQQARDERGRWDIGGGIEFGHTARNAAEIGEEHGRRAGEPVPGLP
jgi:hypothetical protein